MNTSSPPLPPAIQPRRSTQGPLSYSQESMWFLKQLDPDSHAYNMNFLFRFTGGLDESSLEKAVNELVRRHEPFRTIYPNVGGQPGQVVQPFVPFSLTRVDFSGFAENEREEAINKYAAIQGSQPYNLHHGPLFRFALLHSYGNEDFLFFGTHHIGFDGWSLQVFYNELILLYASFSSGGLPDLPETPIQYCDYALWQREWLRGATLDTYVEHWKDRLSGELPVLDLHTDYLRPSIQTYRGTKYQFLISRQLSSQIKAFCQKERITTFHFFLAAYALLLMRYTNQEDIIIGCPFANRVTPGIEKLVGMFINTLPIRINLADNPNGREIIEQVRSVMLDAIIWQEAPFESLVSEITTERDLSRNPVFQVVINMRNFPKHQAAIEGLELELILREDAPAQFDLSLDLEEENNSFAASIKYNTDLFEDNTIAHMAAHYQNLLRELLIKTDQPISEMEILTPSERQRIVFDWNTTSDFPRQKTVHQVFEEIAAATPDAPALSFVNQIVSYQELNSRANQLAHALRDSGVSKEDRVGVFIERSVDMIVALLAILKAGCAYVPLDAANPKERLSFILKDTSAKILLTLQRHSSDLPAFEGKVIHVDNEAVFAGRNGQNPDVPMSAENLAYVMYTSGSTGSPKGSCIPHRGVIRLVKNTAYASFNSQEVFLQFAPLAFDASTFEIWGSLLNGSKLEIFPPYLPNLEDLSGLVKSKGVTTLWLTAGLFHQVIESHPEIVDNLHQLLSGGDVLSPRHVGIGLARNPNCRFINGYGPTENTTFTCCYTVKELSDTEKSLPIGKPIANTSVYILDAHQKPVPVGVAGEIFTGGDGLSREYLNQPELTADKFVPDPFSPEPGKRLLRTGDYGRWLPDGNIEFIGRMDNQVKIRGYRVELEEVENTLKQHPGIRDAIVVARADQSGSKMLVAYYGLSPDFSLDQTQVREFLDQRLPAYMVPTSFVVMDAFPQTPSGKIDRQSLPTPENTQAQDKYLAPRNETEKRLVSIWQEVLGVKRLGVRDNFFELGGHSLLAVRLFSRIQEQFSRSLPLTLLFQDGTVEAIANALNTLEKSTYMQGVSPLGPEGTIVPLFIISASLDTRDLVLDMASGEIPLYNLEPILNGKKTIRKSIQETARIYYQNLVNFYPEGPFQLLGHSGYGLFALEIARLLIENKKEVAFLGILDSYPPGSGWAFVNPIDQGKNKLKYLKGKTIGEILQYPRRSLMKLLTRWGIKLKVNERKLNLYAQQERIRDLMEMIMREYSMEVYPGDVTLFWATDRPRYLRGDPLEQWKKFIAGQFDVIPVVGNHNSILHFPNSGVLARTIEALLSRNKNGRS